MVETDELIDIGLRVKQILEESNPELITDVAAEYSNSGCVWPATILDMVRDSIEPMDPDLTSRLLEACEDVVGEVNAEHIWRLVFLGEDQIEVARSYSRSKSVSSHAITLTSGPDLTLATAPTLTIAQVLQLGQSSVTQVATTLAIHPDLAEAMLHRESWDVNRVLDRWVKNRDGFLSEYGLPFDKRKLSLELMPGEVDECPVCWSDAVLLSLPCGHAMCENCWKEAAGALLKGGEITLRCSVPDCGCPVADQAIRSLLPEHLVAKFDNFKVDLIISRSPTLRRCLSPTCGAVLTVESIGLCSTSLCDQCGNRICWKCPEEAHAPLSCGFLAQWRSLAQEEGLTANWLSKNVLRCPRCGMPIERNSGCTQMRCGREEKPWLGCGHQFCWICRHPISEHRTEEGYRCPAPAVNASKLAADPRFAGVDVAALADAATGFWGHTKSEELDRERFRGRELAEMLAKKFAQEVNGGQAMILARDVIFSLVSARSVLRWSFPASYFMKRGPERDIFVKWQTKICGQIEEVESLVDEPSKGNYQKFKEESGVLAGFTTSMLKFVDYVSRRAGDPGP